jgi:hypothetical protein
MVIMALSVLGESGKGCGMQKKTALAVPPIKKRNIALLQRQCQ